MSRVGGGLNVKTPSNSEEQVQRANAPTSYCAEQKRRKARDLASSPQTLTVQNSKLQEPGRANSPSSYSLTAGENSQS